jgi:hypothetical protein
MTKRPFAIEFFTDGNGKQPCLDWIREELTPAKRRAIGFAMEEVLQGQGVSVCDDRSWGKQLGDGVFEFKLLRTKKRIVRVRGRSVEKTERISLRVFCHAYGDKRILLLGGYDKGRFPGKTRQQKEIALAKRRLRSWTAGRQSAKGNKSSGRRQRK